MTTHDPDEMTRLVLEETKKCADFFRRIMVRIGYMDYMLKQKQKQKLKN